MREDYTYLLQTGVNYLLSTKEVAVLLGTNKNGVGELVKLGKLPYVCIDGGIKRRYRVEDVNAYIESLEAKCL